MNADAWKEPRSTDTVPEFLPKLLRRVLSYRGLASSDGQTLLSERLQVLRDMASVMVFPLVLLVTAIAATHQAFLRGKRSPGFTVALAPALAGISLAFLVALAPMLVFLADGAHPEYQFYYYSAIRVVVWVGWFGMLLAVIWKARRARVFWSALLIVVATTILLLVAGIAASVFVALQV